MKFLHSPSSSSSSSETRPTYAPAGCIPAVLRRLLCFHTLPTFPLDTHITQSYVNNEIEEVFCGDKVKGSPGIVGKLMGLDSMPAEELKFRKHGKCVFKAPTFVEVENEKFIILSFEGGGKDKELKMNCSKTRKGLIESKELNKEKLVCRQSVEDNGEVMRSCKLSNLGKNLKKSCDPECDESGILRKKNVESDSENSSPVSVLEFPDHQEASYSGKDDSQSKNSNSRRKLRGDLDKNAPSTSSSSSCSKTSSCYSVDDGEEPCTNGKEYVGLEKKNVMIGESKGMWEEVCKMTERDVMDSSRVQMERWKGGDFEEIGVCFELQILDQLILELFTMT